MTATQESEYYRREIETADRQARYAGLDDITPDEIKAWERHWAVKPSAWASLVKRIWNRLSSIPADF